MARIYLDHAATTPVLPQARAAVAEAYERWANPSSPHAEGRAARAALEDARSRIREALGWTGELIFTASVTEAAALAFRRCHLHGPKPAISCVEHDAVRGQASEEDRFNLWVDGDGIVTPDALSTWLDLGHGGLVAIQHCNSETGVFQDIAGIGQVIDVVGSFLLVDCAQSAGKYALPDVDLLMVSSSKIGGPPGVAALLVRDLKLLVPGGGQERGYRRGTENLPAIIGFAAALEAHAWDMAFLAVLRSTLEQRLKAAGALVIGEQAKRSAAIGAYAMPGLSAAAQMVRFDAKGFAVSAGSACSSGSLKPGHVLAAMGVQPDVAERVIRVSFGPATTMDEVISFADAWAGMATTAANRAA